MPEDALTRAAALLLALQELNGEIVERVEELAPLVASAVAVDNRRRAALSQAGKRDTLPPAAEQLAELVLGRLGALRPYVAFVTKESADRAAECLTAGGPAPLPELDDEELEEDKP